MEERNLVQFEHEGGKQRRRYAVATDDELEEMAQDFPEPFVDYVRRYGWCSTLGGLFWMMSPRYLAPALADWQLDARVRGFARNALGEVYAVCQGRLVSLSASGYASVSRTDVLGFLNRQVRYPEILRRAEVKDLKRELGPLEWDECYTFTPCLAVEGDIDRKAEKGKLVRYVSIIGQFVAPVSIAASVANLDRPVEGPPLELSAEMKQLLEQAKVTLEKRKREKGY